MATVLVVEDDPISRKFMRLCLERDGFDVVEAGNGREAMLALTARPLDVVVTDYRMPEVTGLDVVAMATRIDANLPCVMVTGATELDVAIKAMSNGAVGYLVKPFTGEALRVMVARALERRRLSEETIRLRLLVPMLERFTVLLADVVEARDIETYAHCQRLIAISDRLAEHLGVPGKERKHLRLGAALHDIGKIAVRDAVLHKPTPLTEEEWREIRRHPDVGAALLETIDQWREARIIVRHHHERYDGLGYPDGLHGDQIPFSARIVCLADAVDVMTIGRHYQRARDPEQVIAEVARNRGVQFDPDVADAFIDLAGRDPAMEHALYSDSRELVAASLIH